MSLVSYSVTLLVLKIDYSCFVIVFLCIWTLKSRLLFVGTANHIYVLVFVLLEGFDVKEEKMWGILRQKAGGVTGLSSQGLENQMLRLRHVASAMGSFAVLFESWLS
ncbi:hypothetical protein Hdeb2414_s0003g00103551 [Helianthus debilis subsp. tardiflorus]